jgi:DNA-binding NtrC family response regulator
MMDYSNNIFSVCKYLTDMTQKKAAEFLGYSYKTLSKKIKKYPGLKKYLKIKRKDWSNEVKSKKFE